MKQDLIKFFLSLLAGIVITLIGQFILGVLAINEILPTPIPAIYYMPTIGLGMLTCLLLMLRD